MKHIYRNDVYIKDGMLVADNTGFGPLPELHYDRVLKRGLDILLCVIALPLVLPLLAILSILIRRDGGPAFFGHVRIGRDGKPFRCWKLRSMVTDSNTRLEHLLATDPKAAAQWKEERKLDNDPRITRLGNVLRKTSLDELPQIYNILRGEMSFVGPRPVPHDELEENYGEHKHVYRRMRPGLTGLWQVSGRNDVSYAERVQMDVDYFASMSLALDIWIVLRTGAAVACRTGR